jgi:hypothetical protein
MNGISDAVPPHLQPCPSCGLTDRVSGVPAVYLAGRNHVSRVVPSTDDQAEHTETRLVTTALSDALAPEPARRNSPFGCLGVLALLVAIGTFVGGAAAGHWFSGAAADPSTPDGGVYPPGLGPGLAPAAQSDYAWLGWISGVALAVGVALTVYAIVRRTAFLKLVAAGRPAAERLWSRAWYCERCGSVHFPARPGEPSRVLTLGEFRETVWTAGRYGHLAPRHPTV